MLKKFLLSIFIVLSCCTLTFAESVTKTIKSLNVNKNAISVAIKDVKTGNTVYSLNKDVPRLPASTLKLVTMASVIDNLGKDYEYSTKFYKSTNNDVYLLLSGDPLFKKSDLVTLITLGRDKNIEPKNFYIDDSAFDRVEWGEGWQWDDELNPLMPKYSAYNFENNSINVSFNPSSIGNPAEITIDPYYPVSFINDVVTDKQKPSNVSIERSNDIAPNMLKATGSVSSLQTKTIPVKNPKIFFVLNLEYVINSKKFQYFGNIKNAKLPTSNIYLIGEVKHPIDNMVSSVIKNSNNYIAETLFKTAGANFANSQGNITNSISMLNSYLDRNNLKSDDIRIVDGSGVSKNNLMTAEFMANFLVHEANLPEENQIINYLPTSGEGTLARRMLYFKDNLKAKTGTLSDASAIAGYITSRRGTTYAFDIMINDAKTNSEQKKNIEEQILRTIYANY